VIKASTIQLVLACVSYLYLVHVFGSKISYLIQPGYYLVLTSDCTGIRDEEICNPGIPFRD